MNKPRIGEIDRRKILISGATVGLTAWHEPVLNAVVLPSHAQTSGTCPGINDVNIIGFWRFTDQNNERIDIEFLNDSEIQVNDRGSTDTYVRISDGTILLDIAGFQPWEGTVTQEDNCNAREITLTIAPTPENTYALPLVGVLL